MASHAAPRKHGWSAAASSGTAAATSTAAARTDEHDLGDDDSALAAPDRVPRFVRVNALHEGNRAPGSGAATAAMAGAVTLGDSAAVAAALGLLPAGAAVDDASAPPPPFDASCVRPVAWLPRAYGVYSLPPGLPLAGTPAVRDGRLAGVDAASLAAVAALDVRPGHAVLDLCAAPGAKLAAVAQALAGAGDLVGVDVSLPRLGTACTLARRYRLVTPGAPRPGWRCRLYHCDGTAWADAVGTPAGVTAVGVQPSAPPQLPPLPVLDSLVEALFRKPHHAALRGLPPPFVPRPPAVAGVAQRLAITSSSGGGAALLEWMRRAQRGDKGPDTDEPRSAAADDSADAPPSAKRPRTDDAPASSSGAPPSPAQVLMAALTAPPPVQYDRVLVDAQCTHDASARHVAKAMRRAEAAGEGDGSGRDCCGPCDDTCGDGDSPPAASAAAASSSSSAAAATTAATSTSLRDTQRGLLLAGYRCLRPGGILVYATCSMSVAQNEEVMSWLLATEPLVAVVPLTTAGDPQPETAPPLPPTGLTPAQEAAWWQATHAALRHPPWTLAPTTFGSGDGGGTARFDPRTSGTSGLFLARLTKRAPAASPSAAAAGTTTAATV
jgi:16S rRNA C967 or C1407 C5-methylase (RsmB/RsmF family)